MPKSTQDIYRELLEQNNQSGGLRGANAGQTVTANQIRDTGGSMGSALRGTNGGTDWNALTQQYFDQIQNRPGFGYDPKNDAMYQMYKDLYVNQGRRAMEDTMGQAAGLTGGYSSTYGQAVGNQAYNEYLTKLNEQIPALYGQARAAYDADTQDLYNLYNIALSNANQQYDREQHDKEYADAQAYQQWQMQQTEQGNAREIALMMLQMGKTPSAELLQQAGISAADAAALAQYYAAQLAGTGSGGSGGGGPYYNPKKQTDDTTDDETKDDYKLAYDRSQYPKAPGPLNHLYNNERAIEDNGSSKVMTYNDLAVEIRRFAGNMPQSKYEDLKTKIYYSYRSGKISRTEADKLLAQMGYKKK